MKNFKLKIIFGFVVFMFTSLLVNMANAQIMPPNALSTYIGNIFVFGLGAVGVVALMMITYGGIVYTISAGNTSKKDEAKDIIYSALMGMGLLLISYILLNTINPDLVSLKGPDINQVQSLQDSAQDPNSPSISAGEITYTCQSSTVGQLGAEYDVTSTGAEIGNYMNNAGVYCLPKSTVQGVENVFSSQPRNIVPQP